VQAFGQEQTEKNNYSKYLTRAKDVGIKTHLKSALSIGGFMFAMYGYYAYAFYFGTLLVNNKIKNTSSN
jgi:hypothetical protein